MSPPASPSNLAELAVELRLAELDVRRSECEAPLTNLSFALKLESIIAADHRGKLEEIAARFGLSRDATGLVLDQWEYRSRLLHEAHLLLRALIPHEAHIRDLAGPLVADPLAADRLVGEAA